MSKCRICNCDNPSDAGRCQHCGAWLEQKIDDNASVAEQPSKETASLPSGMEAEVLGLMTGGDKIEAIKLYRKKTGLGLKEAKDAVEALAARHGIASKGSGCAGVFLVLLACIAVLVCACA
jgi:hypothetical protein